MSWISESYSSARSHLKQKRTIRSDDLVRIAQFSLCSSMVLGYSCGCKTLGINKLSPLPRTFCEIGMILASLNFGNLARFGTEKLSGAGREKRARGRNENGV